MLALALTMLMLALAAALLLRAGPAAAQGGAAGTEPTNIRVVPGDGALTVSWTVTSRPGVADDDIRHALRWSQEPGVWANPPGPSQGAENGIVVEGGVSRYVITGLQNDVAAGVFVRSFTGRSYSERSERSSPWVRTKGEHTTPRAAQQAPAKTYSVTPTVQAAEGGEATLTVTLSEAAPADGVEFNVMLNFDGSAAPADAGSVASPVTVAEGNDALTIAIPTADDAVDEDDETLTVIVAAATPGWEPAGDGKDIATVTITDDDTAGVTVNPTSLSVTEDGSVTYTVVLDSQPTVDATVTASVDDGGAATMTPASVTFTPSGWNIPQTFTVSGVSDADSDDESVGIRHRTTSNDVKYEGVAVASVAVAVADTTPAPAEQQQQQSPGASQDDATLSQLEVYIATSANWDEAGEVARAGPAYPISPTLSPEVTEYTVRVPELYSSANYKIPNQRPILQRQMPEIGDPNNHVTVVATASAGDRAAIAVSGLRSNLEAREPIAAPKSGQTSGPWRIGVGYNWVDIVVTAPDGQTTKSYTVRIEQGYVKPPENVRLTPGDGQLLLTWDAPAEDLPTNYFARWRKAGTQTWLNQGQRGSLSSAITGPEGGKWVWLHTGGPNPYRYAITGLENGVEYEVELQGLRGGYRHAGNTVNLELERQDDWLTTPWLPVRGTPAAPAKDVLTITPTSPTRAYGESDDLSYTVSGLAAGDAPADVVGGALARAPGDDAGTYAMSMGTLAVKAAYADKYSLPAAPAVATYTITPRSITAIGGVTVNSRASDGTTDATFDTSHADGTGVLPAEQADFRAGGLLVSGAFPAATPGTHDLSVTYALRDHGSFKAANYTLSSTTDTLPGELTAVAACGSWLTLFADRTPAEGGAPVTITVGLNAPAGPGGVSVTLTAGGTAIAGDDYVLSPDCNCPSLSTAYVNIPDGATAGTATIAVADDSVDDDDDTIILNAAANSQTAPSLTLTIADNDDAQTQPEPDPTTPHQASTCNPPKDGDYDADDDGLIEICNFAQLSAIEWDLDADGSSANAGYRFPDFANLMYAAAYPDAVVGMGCPQTGCVGYELVKDLDFAEQSQQIWTEIGRNADFSGIFEGNGRVIRNLLLVDCAFCGLFDSTAPTAVIRNVGLLNVEIRAARDHVGGLVGDNGGTILNSWVTGTVSGTNGVGGLVGGTDDTSVVMGSYSTASVTGSSDDVGGLVGGNEGVIAGSFATGDVTTTGQSNDRYEMGNRPAGDGHAVGGLVGANYADARIVASYASGAASGPNGRKIGGLVGYNLGQISASYSVGRASGSREVSGLTHAPAEGSEEWQGFRPSTADSYWDTQTSNVTASAQGVGKTTAELQTPTGYAGIYANWNVDLDGDGNADDPWDFGTASQYPVLKYRGLDVDDQRPQLPTATTVDVIHLTPTRLDGRLRFSDPQQIGDFTNSGYANLIRPLTMSQNMETLYYVNLDARPTADVTVRLKAEPSSHWQLTGRTASFAHFTSRGWQPGPGDPISIVTTADAAGTITITHVGTSDDPNYSGELDTLTINIIRHQPGFCGSLGAPSVALYDNLVVGVVGAPAYCDGEEIGGRIQGYHTEISENGGPWQFFDNRVWPTSRGGSKPTAKEFIATPGVTYQVRSRGNIARINADDPRTRRTPWSEVTTFTISDVPPANPQADYDADDDGLIEVSSLMQLTAIHWDMDGDGYVADSGRWAVSASWYADAFPDAAAGMGCPASGCIGYELAADLDFDTNANGQADAGDAFWNGGLGWRPTGLGMGDFTAVFEGNGHTIRNLYTSFGHDSVGENVDDVGFFASVAAGGVIRNVALESVNVSGGGRVGGLVGSNSGSISGVRVSGSVSGRNAVGGLVGHAHSSSVISGSRSTASAVGTTARSGGGRDVGGLVGYNDGKVSASYAAGPVSGPANNTGGLAGYHGGVITASYATGDVTGSGRYVGGLVGSSRGSVTASYAAGATTGGGDVGGLVGYHGGAVTASYWDADTSQAGGSGGLGKTTTELQTPTGYTGIYAGWNVDLDGDGSPDDPWNFGTSTQYPTLK